MLYKVKQDIIPRDIASVYFLVDIHDKTYYDARRIYSTNQCGYEIFKIMNNFDTLFSIDEIFSRFISLLNNYQDSMHDIVLADITTFIQELVSIGYVIGVEK